jgi:hypothetical protein
MLTLAKKVLYFAASPMQYHDSFAKGNIYVLNDQNRSHVRLALLRERSHFFP